MKHMQNGLNKWGRRVTPGSIWSVLSCFLIAAAVVAQAQESAREPEAAPRLGASDFYPSHERPVGWRGDRTGAFPGAEGVTFWDAETGEHVAWSVDLPGAGFSQPIVVGEKVFLTCEPDLLMCYNVHTGEELWRTAIDHTTQMDPETAEKARAEMKYFDELMLRRGRWSTETEELTVMVEEAGFDKMTVWQNKRHYRVLRKPEGEGDAAKVLANAEIKALWERLYAEQEEYKLGYTGDAHGKTWTAEINQRAAKANALYDDIWFDGAWDGFCPSWPTPCSDGKRIYVSMQNNAVAAVNLDGTIEWMVWDHLGDENGERAVSYGKGISTRYASSPQLYGNYFYVDNDNHQRVYDKRTGEKVWEYIVPYGARAHGVTSQGQKYSWGGPLPEDCIDLDWTAILKEYSQRKGKQRPKHGGRPRNEACSPAILEVPLVPSGAEGLPDGTIMPVVYDGMSFLYRLEDGKVLSADMPFAQCSSAVAYENVVMSKWNEQGGFMVRITAKDRDTLAYEWLHYWYGRGARYDIPLSPAPKGFSGFRGTDTGIVYDGWWYGDPNNGYRASLKDGRIERWGGYRLGGAPSPIVVGNRIYDFSSIEQYPRGTFNIRRNVTGDGSAVSVDIDTGRQYPVETSHIDQRYAEDSDYALRYAYHKAGAQGANSSPYAQANRIFFRTKGVLNCYGDPGQPFPAPKDCPTEARVPTPAFMSAIEQVEGIDDVEKLAPYLEHDHPAVRAAAARRLVASGKWQVASGKGETVEALKRLAASDLSAAVRAAALRALGVGVDEPGGKILAEQIAEAAAAGPWQHRKPPLQRVIHTLRALDGSADPVVLSILNGKARDAVVACVLWGEVEKNDAVRDALLPVLTDKRMGPTVAQTLADWPEDAVVKARFEEILSDPKQHNFHSAAFSYLLPLQPAEERSEFLESLVANSSRDACSKAVGVMVAQGDLEKIRPILAAATGEAPGHIAGALSEHCAGVDNPAVVKEAVSMILDHFEQPDCQAAMVGAITRFYADAEPALPKLKAIDPGDDARLKRALEQAIKVIESKVKGAKKGKK